jgi:predicted ester cyclase
MSTQDNKSMARRYHQFNADEIDDILTPDFVGHHSDGRTWDIASHKKFWSSAGNSLQDTIHVQVAEGDWVATMFTRAGPYQGRQIKLDMMAFKRFQDGKVVEVWEQYDSKLVDE